jgi:hypothetical protein
VTNSMVPFVQFVIPGSTTVFQPKIFITVITHSPFIVSVDDEVGVV